MPAWSASRNGTADSGDVRIVPERVWPWLAGTLLSLTGIGVAAYETLAHYDTHVVLACPNTGEINCALVTTSIYSQILGVPVALLGLLFFIGMLPLQLPWAWRSASRYVRSLRVLGSVVGVGMVLWLLYAELFLLRHICLECTAVHVVTFFLFVVTVIGTTVTAPERGPGAP